MEQVVVVVPVDADVNEAENVTEKRPGISGSTGRRSMGSLSSSTMIVMRTANAVAERFESSLGHAAVECSVACW